MSTKFIGRQFDIGIGRETTRGTAVAAAYWLPDSSLTIDDKIDQVVNDTSVGVIEEGVGADLTWEGGEATVEGRITDIYFGLLLKCLLGTETKTTVVSGIDRHTFTMLQSAQHPTVSVSVYSPNEGTGRVFALGAMDQLDLTFEVGKCSSYKAMFKTGPSAGQSNTPSYTTENPFLPQDMVFNFAPTYPAVTGAFYGTGTAASTTAVTAVSGFNCLDLVIGMSVVGTNIPASTTVAAIVSATAFTLSNASTGNAADLAVGNLQGTITASSTTAATALSGLTTSSLQVGMGVFGKFVPVGTTITAIISSTAFTLSAATTGAADFVAFGPATVPLKKAMLSFKKNVEEDKVLGNTSSVDRLNKAFACSGSFELFYTDRSWIDTVLVGDIYQALQFLLTSTVTIGTASNPTLTINLAKVKLSEVARKVDNKGIVSQTIKFKAFYSLSDAEMTDITLQNTNTSVY